MNYLPPEWQDDERMRVLMGPLPSSKDTVALNSRLTFWSAALHDWCRIKDSITFSLCDAQMAFRRGTQVPLCINEVIQHLLRKGDLVTHENLVTPVNDSESWVTWSKRILISTPSKWAWSTLQSTVGGKNTNNITIIDCRVLQERSEKLLSSLWGCPKNEVTLNIEGVFSVEDLFRIASGSQSLSFEDLNIILHYLAKNKKIAIIEHQGKSLVKLAPPGKTAALLITEIEVAEYQLQSTEQKLKERLKTLQAESVRLVDEARKLVASGLRNQAKSLLRRKKRVNMSIETTLSALENVSSCLHQIQESQLNMDVLNAFHAGVSALKSSVSQMGGVEGVTKNMDSLQDVLDECREITESVAFGATSPEDYDDSGLELELEELGNDGGNGEGGNRFYAEEATLPNVPQANPLLPAAKTREMEFS